MNQEAIQNEYQMRKDLIADAQGEIEIQRTYLKILQRKCPHPDKYQYSAMGELGTRCPDCGYAT